MITLPNECLIEILKNNYGSLFSCLLVNRQWCRNVVPILWREPDLFRNEKLVRTCLSLLNKEEQALLVPFNIILPNNQKPLFDYATYTKVIRIRTYGIEEWLKHEGCQNFVVIRIIQNLLVKMFLRTSKALLDFDCEGGCENLLRDILNSFKNLTSLTLRNNFIESDKALAKALYKNTALTYLSIENCQLNLEVGITIADALCENTTLTFLNVQDNQFGSEGGKAIANALYQNTTLTHLDISSNQLGPEGGKAIAKSLYNNSTLIRLNINDNQIDSECGKEFAKVLYKNTTLTFLDINYNQIDFETENAFVIHATRVEVILDSEDYDDYTL